MPTVTNFSRYLSSSMDLARQTDPVMPKRPLGRTGLVVGEVGLGTAPLDHPGLSGAPDGEGREIIELALDMQASLVDVEAAPGSAENRALGLLGAALKGRRRQAVVSLRVPGGPEDLERGLDKALEVLGTDRVEVLLWDKPFPEDLKGRDAVWHALARAKKAGKALAVGASVEGADAFALALRTPAEVLRFPLNVFDQSCADLLPQAGAKGLGLIASRPLDSGWLGGRYGARHVFLDSRRRWSGEDKARRAALQRSFEELAVAPGATAAQAALRFTLGFPELSCAAPSASDWHQVVGNVDAARLALEPGVWEGLRRLWRESLAQEPLQA